MSLFYFVTSVEILDKKLPDKFVDALIQLKYNLIFDDKTITAIQAKSAFFMSALNIPDLSVVRKNKRSGEVLLYITKAKQDLSDTPKRSDLAVLITIVPTGDHLLDSDDVDKILSV